MSVYKWVPYSCGCVPPNAVEAGYDVDGSKIYIGKTKYAGGELPCKIVPSRKQAYVSHNSKEHEIHCSEIMVEATLSWQHCDGMCIPPNAVAGGRTVIGETLYIGRASHSGSLCVGKVHPSHGCIYIPFAGVEISIKSFEVLVAN